MYVTRNKQIYINGRGYMFKILINMCKDQKSWRHKNKNKQVGPSETSKLLHSKGNHKQDKKTNLRMGENSGK